MGKERLEMNTSMQLVYKCRYEECVKVCKSRDVLSTYESRMLGPPKMGSDFDVGKVGNFKQKGEWKQICGGEKSGGREENVERYTGKIRKCEKYGMVLSACTVYAPKGIQGVKSRRGVKSPLG